MRLTLTVTVFPRTSEPVPPRRSKAWRIAAAASAPYERARVSATTPLPADGGTAVGDGDGEEGEPLLPPQPEATASGAVAASPRNRRRLQGAAHDSSYSFAGRRAGIRRPSRKYPSSTTFSSSPITR